MQKRIPYNWDNVSLVQQLIKNGLGNDVVVYSAISFVSEAVDDEEYTFRRVEPFFITVDGEYDAYAENEETIPEDKITEYINTIIAMNYCFNLRVFIQFGGGTGMDVYLPIFGK